MECNCFAKDKSQAKRKLMQGGYKIVPSQETPSDDERSSVAARRITKIALWGAINRYVETCGGNPALGVYGNSKRKDSVAEIERLVFGETDGCKETC